MIPRKDPIGYDYVQWYVYREAYMGVAFVFVVKWLIFGMLYRSNVHDIYWPIYRVV